MDKELWKSKREFLPRKTLYYRLVVVLSRNKTLPVTDRREINKEKTWLILIATLKFDDKVYKVAGETDYTIDF